MVEYTYKYYFSNLGQCMFSNKRGNRRVVRNEGYKGRLRTYVRQMSRLIWKWVGIGK